MVLALLHGLASITFRGDQLISGVAINFLAAGLTVIIAQDWFAQGGRTPGLSGAARFKRSNWPFADAARDIPIFGPFYQELVSGHTFLVYIALLAVPTAWYVLFPHPVWPSASCGGRKSGSGRHGRHFGRPAAVFCGADLRVLVRIGRCLPRDRLSAGFVKEMSAGAASSRLAALIFAKWRPWQALGACLLFGLLEALGNRYQNIDVATLLIVSIVVAIGVSMAIRSQDKPGIYLGGGIAGIGVLLWLSRGIIGLGDSFTVPVQFMQALPYILTVVILAGFVGKAIPPRAGGSPYVKES